MEVTRVEELLSKAVDEQLAEQRSWRDAVVALTERIERLEQAIEALRADIAATVEAAAASGLSARFDTVSTELRRQVSDLGRLIVNDLGRLPQLVRDALPAALAAPATPPAAAPADDPPDAEAHQAVIDLERLPYAEGDDEEAQQRRGLFRRR